MRDAASRTGSNQHNYEGTLRYVGTEGGSRFSGIESLIFIFVAKETKTDQIIIIG